jgi:hypothetical protein
MFETILIDFIEGFGSKHKFISLILFGYLFVTVIMLSAIMSGTPTEKEIALSNENDNLKWMIKCMAHEPQWKCELLSKSPGSPWVWLDQNFKKDVNTPNE